MTLYFCYLYFMVKWKLKEGKDSVHGSKPEHSSLLQLDFFSGYPIHISSNYNSSTPPFCCLLNYGNSSPYLIWPLCKFSHCSPLRPLKYPLPCFHGTISLGLSHRTGFSFGVSFSPSLDLFLPGPLLRSHFILEVILSLTLALVILLMIHIPITLAQSSLQDLVSYIQ